MKAVTLFLLFPTVVCAQSAPVHKSAPNLSEKFARSATVATKAIADDDLAVDVTKPTATSDRIDEGAALAVSDAEKSFVDVLRGFYVGKEAHNLLIRIKRVSGVLDAPAAGPCADEQDCNAQFEKRLAQDRDVAKNRVNDGNCFAALTEILKSRVYTGAPTACPAPRKL